MDMNKSNKLINLGDTELLAGSFRNSLCNLMAEIKFKGVGRPKRKKINRNPFEIGKCKFWSRQRKFKTSNQKYILMDSSLVAKENLEE